MNAEEVKLLQVQLKLDRIHFVDCIELSKAFGHACFGPFKCFSSIDGEVYFLCNSHRDLVRREFREIKSIEDFQ